MSNGNDHKATAENAQWQGAGPSVTYEVWRSGPGKAPDVRIFSDRTTPEAVQDALDICLADKADGYPDAPIEFYVVRVTRTREVVTPPAKCPACPHEPHGQWCQNAAGETCPCDHVYPPAMVADALTSAEAMCNDLHRPTWWSMPCSRCRSSAEALLKSGAVVVIPPEATEGGAS